ncbi:MAG: LysM peptidoglycan-binding domain-containing protein, partial [Anaerolineae bacterium]|nr:LysM peptidoglycan-binding domain-containing protein [Anaerolineae bacterium]
YHVVRWGETLWSIARLYGTTPWAIAALNGIYNLNLIYAGQVLRVR